MAGTKGRKVEKHPWAGQHLSGASVPCQEAAGRLQGQVSPRIAADTSPQEVQSPPGYAYMRHPTHWGLQPACRGCGVGKAAGSQQHPPTGSPRRLTLPAPPTSTVWLVGSQGFIGAFPSHNPLQEVSRPVLGVTDSLSSQSPVFSLTSTYIRASLQPSFLPHLPPLGKRSAKPDSSGPGSRRRQGRGFGLRRTSRAAPLLKPQDILRAFPGRLASRSDPGHPL